MIPNRHDIKEWICKIALPAILIVTAGCVSGGSQIADVPESPEEVHEKVGIQFQIEVPSIDGSRATPAGAYDDARLNAYENYVAPELCQALVFGEGSGNTTLRGMVTDITVEAREDNSNHQAKRYTVWGYVEKELIETGNFKIMILVNCNVQFTDADTPAPDEIKIIPGNTTIDDIAAMSVYNYDSSWTLGVDYIPMYGIKECRGVVLPDNYMIWLDTVQMLRAMAKVEVTSSADVDIDRAILYNYSSKGYAIPLGVYSEGDYVKGSYIDDYVDGISVPSASIRPEAIDLPYYTDDEGIKHFYAYVPEYKNASGDAPLANASYIDIFFKDATIAGRLDFKYYDRLVATANGANEGAEFDLLRNYYYRFSVKDILFNLEAEVHPYFESVLAPDFGLETGQPIWEDLWSVKDVPMSMNTLSTGHFDWSKLTPGRELRLYFFDRTAPDAADTEFFWISVRRYSSGGDPITGTQMQYLIDDPAIENHTLLKIELTQAMIDDIVAHKGISILARYCILYRVTIK